MFCIIENSNVERISVSWDRNALEIMLFDYLSGFCDIQMVHIYIVSPIVLHERAKFFNFKIIIQQRVSVSVTKSYTN